MTPKAFDLLLVLAENPGRLLTKEQLLQAIWSDTAVEESNLSYHVFAIRKALGDTAENGLITTVPKSGYRFTMAVTHSNGRALNRRCWPTTRPSRPDRFPVARQVQLEYRTSRRRALLRSHILASILVGGRPSGSGQVLRSLSAVRSLRHAAGRTCHGHWSAHKSRPASSCLKRRRSRSPLMASIWYSPGGDAMESLDCGCDEWVTRLRARSPAPRQRSAG